MKSLLEELHGQDRLQERGWGAIQIPRHLCSPEFKREIADAQRGKVSAQKKTRGNGEKIYLDTRGVPSGKLKRFNSGSSTAANIYETKQTMKYSSSTHDA